MGWAKQGRSEVERHPSTQRRSEKKEGRDGRGSEPSQSQNRAKTTELWAKRERIRKKKRKRIRQAGEEGTSFLHVLRSGSL